MKFSIKRDILLKSLNLVQGVIEKKNTLPILSNVLLDVKKDKIVIVATDLDLIFYEEISDVVIEKEGSTTTSAAILYDILRKVSANSELVFDLKSENKLGVKVENSNLRKTQFLLFPKQNHMPIKLNYINDNNYYYWR